MVWFRCPVPARSALAPYMAAWCPVSLQRTRQGCRGHVDALTLRLKGAGLREHPDHGATSGPWGAAVCEASVFPANPLWL